MSDLPFPQQPRRLPTEAEALQAAIVEAVARRGYLDGWTTGQLIARQLVKLLEEVAEAFAGLNTGAAGADLGLLVCAVRGIAKQARLVFDSPAAFDGVAVDPVALARELPDLVVPTAVLAYLLHFSDMMEAGALKASADVARGVR